MSHGESSCVKASSPKTGKTWNPLPTQWGRGAGMTLRTAFGTAAAAIRRILSLLQVMSSQVLSACTERTDEAGEKAAEHCRTAESPTTPIARRVRSIVPGCRPVLALPCIYRLCRQCLLRQTHRWTSFRAVSVFSRPSSSPVTSPPSLGKADSAVRVTAAPPRR